MQTSSSAGWRNPRCGRARCSPTILPAASRDGWQPIAGTRGIQTQGSRHQLEALRRTSACPDAGRQGRLHGVGDQLHDGDQPEEPGAPGAAAGNARGRGDASDCSSASMPDSSGNGARSDTRAPAGDDRQGISGNLPPMKVGARRRSPPPARLVIRPTAAAWIGSARRCVLAVGTGSGRSVDPNRAEWSQGRPLDAADGHARRSAARRRSDLRARRLGTSRGPISPATVARVRAASKGRQTPWTRTELSALGAR